MSEEPKNDGDRTKPNPLWVDAEYPEPFQFVKEPPTGPFFEMDADGNWRVVNCD